MPSTRKKSTKTVTKKQYEKWESSIIADNNRIVPRDGEPKLVKRRKVMIVCDFQCAGAKKEYGPNGANAHTGYAEDNDSLASKAPYSPAPHRQQLSRCSESRL